MIQLIQLNNQNKFFTSLCPSFPAFLVTTATKNAQRALRVWDDVECIFEYSPESLPDRMGRGDTLLEAIKHRKKKFHRSDIFFH